MNEVVTPAVVFGHCFQRLPIDSLFINAEATPGRLVLEHLMSELVDARSCFAGASVSCDEPAAAELIPPPCQPFEPGDDAPLGSGKEKQREGDDNQQSSQQQALQVVGREP